MKRQLLQLHRGLALSMAVFWLLQGATGIVLVFRWEIEDKLLQGTAAEADAAALGERIAALERDGAKVLDLWATSMAASRFDIYYAAVDGTDRVLRVDGNGHTLRDSLDGEPIANGGIFSTLTKLHSSLLGGDAGTWFVAASGTLLLTTLLLGLRLAWPARRVWRRALFFQPVGVPSARALGWHRLAGVWGAVLLLPLVCAGLLLCFEDTIQSTLNATIPEPIAPAVGQVPQSVGITPVTAIAVALTHHEGSTLSAMVMPTIERPWFRVRVRRPDDPMRNWGTTTVFVSASDGRILADHPAATAPMARALAETLYPLHTGQLGGYAGRGLVLLAGLSLVTLIGLGLRLWWLRRARPAPAGANATPPAATLASSQQAACAASSDRAGQPSSRGS